ncbi:uncharacterized protein LOC134480387 [Rattus norvegicus]|uniref:uncharacterized protein LOC134480387 n=1 Tax=Rattus norvegicus TaxID=10116 RepID=UPI002FD7D159
MGGPRRFDDTPPRPQNSLGQSRTGIPVSQFPLSVGDLYWTSAGSGHSAGACSARITLQLAMPGSSESAGRAGGLKGAGRSPSTSLAEGRGHPAQSLRPIWWRWRQRAGVCVAIWRAPGLMLRSRPCLTRAERTKRSGPVCARGSSRGRSGGPGAWRSRRRRCPVDELLRVRRRSAIPLAAALTCSLLWLTRRRQRRTPQSSGNQVGPGGAGEHMWEDSISTATQLAYQASGSIFVNQVILQQRPAMPLLKRPPLARLRTTPRGKYQEFKPVQRKCTLPFLNGWVSSNSSHLPHLSTYFFP